MKREEQADEVVLQPDGDARAAVIWLHGLGADGYDFVPIVGELRLPASLGVRFVFPHAPVRPVSLNMGMPMRAWYDIKSLDRGGIQDEQGIRESAARVEARIGKERAAGIPANRIVIAGFSQGGAVALHTALRHQERLAGLLALSTYLPLAEKLGAEAHAANRDLPILMSHGTHDGMLPVTLGEWSRDALAAQKYTVDWRPFPMAHEVCLEEIELIGGWLAQLLK